VERDMGRRVRKVLFIGNSLMDAALLVCHCFVVVLKLLLCLHNTNKYMQAIISLHSFVAFKKFRSILKLAELHL